MPKSRPGEDMPYWRALVAPVLAHAFDELEESACHFGLTRALRFGPTRRVFRNSGTRFTAHQASCNSRWSRARKRVRYRYNDRSFAQVRKERKVVRGTHGGFHNLFMPVGEGAVEKEDPRGGTVYHLAPDERRGTRAIAGAEPPGLMAVSPILRSQPTFR